MDPVAAAQSMGLFQGQRIEAKRFIELSASAPQFVTPRHTSKLPVGPRGSSIYVETVAVSKGRVDAFIPKKAGAGIMLMSDDMVQAISTLGRVSMTCLDDGRVVVAALEGDALAGKSGGFRPLPEGSLRIFDKEGHSTDRQLLAAPRVEHAKLGVALSGTAPVELRATAVSGAHQYRAFLVDSRGKAAGVESTSKTENVTVSAPHAGSFSAFYRAIDEFGYAGALSSEGSVRVLGLKPGQGSIRDGMIELGVGERAEIVGQDGLLMNYGSSPDFFKAPRYVTLPGRNATSVEFRDPKDPTRSAVFQIVPRVLKTKIALGPAMGTWPEDPVDVKITMLNAEGQTFNWRDSYRVQVRVGLEELEVDWNFEAGVLSGQVSPQQGPGPWVVRVSVFDTQNNEVTRNFLEVSRTPQPPIIEGLTSPGGTTPSSTATTAPAPKTATRPKDRAKTKSNTAGDTPS